MTEQPSNEEKHVSTETNAPVMSAEDLCLADDTWEHHDQTDDYPCTRCGEKSSQIEAEKAK